jgi:hypothetical protein
MNFKPLTLKEEPLFREYEKAFINAKGNDYLGSELNFECVFIWGSNKNAYYYADEYALYLSYHYGSIIVFYPPMVKSLSYFPTAVKNLYEHCKAVSLKFKIKQCSAIMCKILNDTPDILKVCDFRTVADDAAHEYIYSPEDLILLSGKKYGAKRNHLNYFFSAFEYELIGYDAARHDEIIAFTAAWSDNKTETDESNLWELEAIKTALKYYKELNLKIELLYVNKTLIAYTVGYINAANIGVVLFEKALTGYKGSYAAINNLFAKKYLGGCRYVNRQEDLGLEGLRRAKESYYPVMLDKKYKISCKCEE